MTSEELTKALSYMPVDLASNPRAPIWLDMASYRVGKSYFCDAYSLALSLMASHIGTLEMRGGGAGGAISSRKEGSISQSFANKASDSDLASTSFGQQYQNLMRQYYKGTGITGGCV